MGKTVWISDETYGLLSKIKLNLEKQAELETNMKTTYTFGDVVKQCCESHVENEGLDYLEEGEK